MSTTRRTVPNPMPPNEMAAYGIREAGRFLWIAPATLRSWAMGRAYPKASGEGFFPPLLRLPDPERAQLSFDNLVEAHVLWALRVRHQVPLKQVREAIRYAEKELGIERLLLSPELRTDSRQIFLKKYGELITLTLSGQMAMEEVLQAHLKRMEWDVQSPARLFPFPGPARPDEERVIAIDPSIQFGRPVVYRLGVSTATIAARLDAGEAIQDIRADYGLEEDEIKAAVVFERAA